MKYSFQNKIAWITGASAGIGEAMALALAANKASLVLSARSEKALEVVAKKCRDAGAPHVWVRPLDLTNAPSLEVIAAAVIAEIGTIDILINNGGVSQRSYVKETPMEVYRQLMEVNYFGAVALTKAVLPAMFSRQSGQIVTISSLVGKIGSPLRSGYAASKHALHGFFDSLRAEVYDDNIKVMMVCPGFIKTNVSVNALNAAGDATGQMDKNQEEGMLPSVAATKILNGIVAGKQEINIGGKEILVLKVKRFLPGWVNDIVRKKH